MLDELITQKLTEEKGERLAMMVYPVGARGRGMRTSRWSLRPAGAKGSPRSHANWTMFSAGWRWASSSRAPAWMRSVGAGCMQSFLILGALSLLMIGGLVLTYRSVSKEMALARLKSDFVSNVSHELRTPLALIRLYAETLELGRITTQEKKEEYYRIIRKESERLTALINNILDFSRIEAGRKEYDFRETDIAELVRNTLDAYRYQIEQQGFAFEQSIDSSIPAVRVDREAIARALVNLVNNALKYSADEKFLGVKLYRANDVVEARGGRSRHRHHAARAVEDLREVLPHRRSAGAQHERQRPGLVAGAPHHARARRRGRGGKHARERQQVHPVVAAGGGHAVAGERRSRRTTS